MNVRQLLCRWLPVVLICTSMALLAWPSTRDFADWLLAENHPIEMLTFLALLAASAAAFAAAHREWLAARDIVVITVFVLLGTGAFLTAGEEVAWGQWFLHFQTPEEWQALNSQGETTIHNLKWFQGKSELPRMLFGVAGLVAIAARTRPALAGIAAPACLEWWFGVITVHAWADLLEDRWPLPRTVAFAISRSSEVTEMLIGLSALAYAWWHWRSRVSQAHRRVVS